MTTIRPGEDRVTDAARNLYEAEVGLHIARQTGVDAWIAAAYDHLHRAVVEYEAALARPKRLCPVQSSPLGPRRLRRCAGAVDC